MAIRTLQIPNLYLAAMSVGRRIFAFHGGPELQNLVIQWRILAQEIAEAEDSVTAVHLQFQGN